MIVLTVLNASVQCGYDCVYKFNGGNNTKYCLYYEEPASIGSIAGGSIGGLVILATIIVACVKLCKKRSRSQLDDTSGKAVVAYNNNRNSPNNRYRVPDIFREASNRQSYMECGVPPKIEMSTCYNSTDSSEDKSEDFSSISYCSTIS